MQREPKSLIFKRGLTINLNELENPLSNDDFCQLVKIGSKDFKSIKEEEELTIRHTKWMIDKRLSKSSFQYFDQVS